MTKRPALPVIVFHPWLLMNFKGIGFDFFRAAV